MKRIAGASALLLLTGLCGCISVTPPAGAEDKKSTGVVRRTSADSTAHSNALLPPVMATADNHPAPVTPVWNTGSIPNVPPTGLVDHTAARPTSASSEVVPSSLPPLQKVNPPRPGQTAQASRPSVLPVHPDMPSATTPKGEAGVVQPANHVQEQQREPAATITGNRTEVTPAPRAVSVPPAPTVKNSAPAEPHPTTMSSGKGGAPLFRLVNTKRITLNFEVKDVGASGLASVELWFTQDGKEWKKHDAPPQAKAYVVEVDEEGMYGFTLIAKSGTGLAKEPPQPGDSPQVWVIVDLTKPDVQMNEVVPNLQSGQQTVSIKWRATDKNMGRQPITLSYAEKDEGPWKVIAAGLDNVGSFNWDVPKGLPAKVLFRVEASDLAGNVGRAQIAKPVMMDNSVPSVKILEVDANGSR